MDNDLKCAKCGGPVRVLIQKMLYSGVEKRLVAHNDYADEKSCGLEAVLA